MYLYLNKPLYNTELGVYVCMCIVYRKSLISIIIIEAIYIKCVWLDLDSLAYKLV